MDLKSSMKVPINIFTLFVLLCFCVTVSAAEIAAQVILSKGQASVTSPAGKVRSLKRRAKIYSGDVIKTGGNGSVQLRFIDKALMTIKPGSELNITSYLYDDGTQQTSKKEVVMSLVAGGFRTITGIIGKGNKSAYRVQTPAASVGIRGTNYEIQQEVSGSFVMAVYVGGISVENEAGSIDLGLGSDFNYTRVTPGEAPKGLLVIPASLSVNAADDQEEEEQQEKEAASESEESDEEEKEAVAEESTTTEDESSQTEAQDEPSETVLLVEKVVPVEEAAPDVLAKAVVPEEAEDLSDSSATVEDTPVVSNPSVFEDPFKGLDIEESPLPEVLSDEEWSLAHSGNIGAINMNLGYTIGSDGLPNFNSQLESPNAINVNNFIPFDYSASGQYAYLDFNYTTFDSVSQVGTNHTAMMYIDTDINTPQDLVDKLNFELGYNSVPVQVSLVDDPSGQRFVFEPVNSGDDFISLMYLSFNSSNTVPDQQLMAQLGGSSSSPNSDWFWSTNTFLSLGNGSWREDNDSPIWTFIAGSVDSDGEYYHSFIEVATRDTEDTVDSFEDFKDCANKGKICDIQINDVNDANDGNIRWGAWLASAGDGVEVTINSGGSEFSFLDESNLIFGVFGERADINDLKGNMSFSGGGDCSDYGQCIGFADDGVVSNFSGQFDVNFSNGEISNGQLDIETMSMDDQVMSAWDVQFNGQMHLDSDQNLMQPEFYTQAVSGHIYDSSGATITNEVIGTVGGIFIKPGNVFAGGFNLGTSDNINKHTTGVFTLKED
ncbi:MAG: FecR family protein [Bermanella sp.]